MNCPIVVTQKHKCKPHGRARGKVRGPPKLFRVHPLGNMNIRTYNSMLCHYNKILFCLQWIEFLVASGSSSEAALCRLKHWSMLYLWSLLRAAVQCSSCFLSPVIHCWFFRTTDVASQHWREAQHCTLWRMRRTTTALGDRHPPKPSVKPCELVLHPQKLSLYEQ